MDSHSQGHLQRLGPSPCKHMDNNVLYYSYFTIHEKFYIIMSGRQHSLPTNTMKSNATITFLKEVYPEHIMTSKNIDLFGILGLHRVRDRNLTSAEICDKCNPYVLKKDKLRAMNSDKNSKQKHEQLAFLLANFLRGTKPTHRCL